MLTRILVPLDGSPLSERALPYAESLATMVHAELRLVQAIDTWALLDGGRHNRNQRELTQAAERRLLDTVTRLQATGLQVKVSVNVGEATSVIASERKAGQCDLIAMSTHGRGGLGRLAYGSVAERVLRLGDCPVLLIPPAAGASWVGETDRTVVIPLDGSELAEEAIGLAREIARMFGATLSIVQVVEPPPPAAYDSFGAPGAVASPYMDVAEWPMRPRPMPRPWPIGFVAMASPSTPRR